MDRLAAEGVVFRHAFVSAPSCTPSRSALFSGRHFFNTGRGAILRPAFWDETIPAYPQRLIDAGYRIGKSLKAWRPGSPVDAPIGGQAYAYEAAGMNANSYSSYVSERVEAGVSPDAAKAELLEEVRANFRAFMDDNADGAPWHYFLRSPEHPPALGSRFRRGAVGNRPPRRWRDACPVICRMFRWFVKTWPTTWARCKRWTPI